MCFLDDYFITISKLNWVKIRSELFSFCLVLNCAIKLFETDFDWHVLSQLILFQLAALL